MPNCALPRIAAKHDKLMQAAFLKHASQIGHEIFKVANNAPSYA